MVLKRTVKCDVCTRVTHWSEDKEGGGLRGGNDDDMHGGCEIHPGDVRHDCTYTCGKQLKKSR